MFAGKNNFYLFTFFLSGGKQKCVDSGCMELVVRTGLVQAHTHNWKSGTIFIVLRLDSVSAS